MTKATPARRSAKASNPPTYAYPCARWVRPKKFAELTGMTEKAAEGRRLKGDWPEGVIWVTAPDGQIRYNVQEYDAWVESSLMI